MGTKKPSSTGPSGPPSHARNPPKKAAPPTPYLTAFAAESENDVTPSTTVSGTRNETKISAGRDSIEVETENGGVTVSDGGVTVSDDNSSLGVQTGPGSFGINGSTTRRNGLSVGGGGSVTYVRDREYLHYAASNYGPAAWAHNRIGGPVVGGGLQDETGVTGSLNGGAGPWSVGVSANISSSSDTSFYQHIDSVRLDGGHLNEIEAMGGGREAREQWIADNPTSFLNAAAADQRRRLEGVNSPGDLALVLRDGDGVTGLNDAVLPDGSAYRFDNSGTAGGGLDAGFGAISISASGSSTDFNTMTIVRPNGSDELMVTLEDMAQTQMNGGLSFGPMGLGTQNTNRQQQSLTLRLDPNDPRQLTQLEGLQQIGLLPGAEVTLPRAERIELDRLKESQRRGDLSSDQARRMAELTQDANGGVLSGDVDLTELDGAEYERRLRAGEEQQTAALGLAGFDLYQQTISHRNWEADYIQDAVQETEYGYAYDRSGSNRESSNLILNPQYAPGFELISGSTWRATQDQAQDWRALGLSGSDDFRVQGMADGSLHSTTGRAQATVALDEIHLRQMSEHFASGAGAGRAHWERTAAALSDRDPLNRFMNDYYELGDGFMETATTDDILRLTEPAFLDHYDAAEMERTPEARRNIDQARRDAWESSETEIFEALDAQGIAHDYDDIQQLVADMASGRIDPDVARGVENRHYDADVTALNDFENNLEDRALGVTGITTAEEFGALSRREQDMWIAHHATYAPGNSFWSLEMIQGAVDAAPPQDRERLRADLTRSAFEQEERNNGSRQTGTSEMISFIGDLVESGGENEALGRNLASGVHVSIVDEGVMERSDDVLESGVLSSTGSILDHDASVIRDIERETNHLLDNNGGRNLSDADQLYDRLEGFAMAAGPNRTQAIEGLVEHLAEQTGQTPGAFVSDLRRNTVQNDEYAEKLRQLLDGTSYS